MKLIPFLWLAFLLSLVTGNATAQTIEVLTKSGIKPDSASKYFNFLEPATDTSDIKFIATIKATGDKKHSGIDELFFKIREEALKRGGLFFKLNSYSKTDSTRPAALTLDIYSGTDSAEYRNFDNHEKNVIFIFGMATKEGKSSSFKISGEKKEIQSGTYYKHSMKENEEVKINKGGFSGSTLFYKWKPNRPASFITLTGFGLGGGPVPTGVMGASFNTGRIYFIDGDLGHLLAQLLTKAE